jgi:HSP20 family protein
VTTDLTRRDPFPSVRQMMERFFDDSIFRDQFFSRLPYSFTTEEGTLPLDIREHDGKLIVEASLPGFTKENIDVQVHDGVLSIRAQHSEEKEERNGNGRYYRRERTWGALSRRVALPGIVDNAQVEAELKNGVLTLTIPLPEQVSPKQIEIKGE